MYVKKMLCYTKYTKLQFMFKTNCIIFINKYCKKSRRRNKRITETYNTIKVRLY